MVTGALLLRTQFHWKSEPSVLRVPSDVPPVLILLASADTLVMNWVSSKTGDDSITGGSYSQQFQ